MLEAQRLQSPDHLTLNESHASPPWRPKEWPSSQNCVERVTTTEDIVAKALQFLQVEDGLLSEGMKSLLRSAFLRYCDEASSLPCSSSHFNSLETAVRKSGLRGIVINISGLLPREYGRVASNA